MHSSSFISTGTSVSVYFILANDDYKPKTTTRTECNFILDGSLEKSYAWNRPLDRKGTEYNTEVFRKEGLENRLHTLDVETGKKDYNVYIAFDYATYTVEEPDEIKPNGTSSSKNVLTGAIAGGVVGGLALIVGILLALFVCRRRRNMVDQHGDNSAQVTPYRVHSEMFDSHRTSATGFRSKSGVLAPSPPVAHQNPLIVRTPSYTFASHPNANNTVAGLESPIAGVEGGSLTLIPISGLSKEASDSLMWQGQLDRMREDSSGLELQSSHSSGYHATPDSRSGIVQDEMDKLRGQIRALQAQIIRQEPQLAAINTSPPTYTP
ncbi:hypothetical protein PQX77_011372 [Marasmius sp. AFHP31]|nr:hypothetical protein PQX77_011372 [Marasmius sp. AFHP31]